MKQLAKIEKIKIIGCECEAYITIIINGIKLECYLPMTKEEIMKIFQENTTTLVDLWLENEHYTNKESYEKILEPGEHLEKYLTGKSGNVFGKVTEILGEDELRLKNMHMFIDVKGISTERIHPGEWLKVPGEWRLYPPEGEFAKD